tara:strand:- start:1246 stop:3093 length:1848 start_codon:yes stop_codon:yes gene_type:complete
MTRRIEEEARYKNFDGTPKVFIFDECFIKGTKVKTVDGLKNIEDIKQGDFVYNKNGVAKVKHTFINKVNKDRIIKLGFSDGTDIVCSEDHLFLTDSGWKKAKDLKDINIFTFSDVYSKLKHSSSLLIRYRKGFYYASRKLRALRERIYFKDENYGFLRKILCYKSKIQKAFSSNYFGKTLCMVQKINESENKQKSDKKILFSFLSRKLAKQTTGDSEKKKYCSIEKKGFRYHEEKAFGESELGAGLFCKNEEKQSYVLRKNDSENESLFESYRTYFQSAGRQWAFDCFSTTFGHCFAMGYGSGGEFGKTGKGLSYKLQNRYSEFGIEIGNRSGWKSSRNKKGSIKRQKEGKKIKRVRVENIEIYKQGDTDRFGSGSKKDSFGDSEIIEMYDLEIEGHPSYFANNILVHNCHMLTKEAQSSLLTTIEDTTAGACFIFCSTDPQKIISPIRSRCAKYEVSTLRSKDMKKVLDRVIKAAKLKIDDELINLIIETSDGVPRDALVKLGMLEGITDMDEAIDLVYKDLYESEVIELCRLVVGKGSWKEIVTVFKGLPKTQDFEALKAITMGYLGACLLNVNNKKDSLYKFTELMDIFVGPLDYSSPRNDFLLRLTMAYLK